MTDGAHGDGILRAGTEHGDPRAHEHELASSLGQALDAHPEAQAVLVRRHGLYVWGRDFVQAKTHAECLDHLFLTAREMRRMGIDPSRPPQPGAGHPAHWLDVVEPIRCARLFQDAIGWTPSYRDGRASD